MWILVIRTTTYDGGVALATIPGFTTQDEAVAAGETCTKKLGKPTYTNFAVVWQSRI